MYRSHEVERSQGRRRVSTAILVAGIALLGALVDPKEGATAEPAPADAGDLFDQPAAGTAVDSTGHVVERIESGRLDQNLRATSVQVMREKSFLAQGTTGVDPFVSNDASAVIGRPSMSQLFDSAVDFNNEEATFGLKVAPALLVTPWPDWYVTGLSLIGSANTEQKNFSVGGKWDINFRDPRFAYAFYHQEVETEYRLKANGTCGSRNDDPSPQGRLKFLHCRRDVMSAVVADYHERLKANPFAFSAGGNATYDNNGHFGGGNAALAISFTREFESGFSLVMTANGKYDDALPSDEEFEQIKKQTMMPDLKNDDRDQKLGGGLELAIKRGLGGENGNERSIELGFGAAALACLDGACDQLSDSSSVKLNPFVAIALTKSIGGRIDVFWDGTGKSVGDAIAGVSFKYAFRGLEAPLSSGDDGGSMSSAIPE